VKRCYKLWEFIAKPSNKPAGILDISKRLVRRWVGGEAWGLDFR
jgi:hypothetical protein